MTDPADQYDAWAHTVRDQTHRIHQAVRLFPSEAWVTAERIELAQKVARRLQEVVEEFGLDKEEA